MQVFTVLYGLIQILLLMGSKSAPKGLTPELVEFFNNPALCV